MLIPREHGVYGQLGFPIATALGAGHVSLSALALTSGFVAAFLAHESLLVLLGARGTRARREQKSAAIRDGTCLAIAAVVGISVGVALNPSVHPGALAVPAVCAAIVVALALGHFEKTTFGEMFVALTCASCAVPVGMAAGLPTRSAVAIWAAMTLGYWAATAAVRGTIAVHRREPQAAIRVSGVLLALAGAPLLFIASQGLALRATIWIATVPLSLLSLAVLIAPPHARHLRRVGWALIAASTVASVLLIILLRT
jgi:hypothetical protein